MPPPRLPRKQLGVILLDPAGLDDGWHVSNLVYSVNDVKRWPGTPLGITPLRGASAAPRICPKPPIRHDNYFHRSVKIIVIPESIFSQQSSDSGAAPDHLSALKIPILEKQKPALVVVPCAAPTAHRQNRDFFIISMKKSAWSNVSTRINSIS
jgi:hypothetical protein